MRQSFVFSLFVFLVFTAQAAIAQPPGINRWNGNTANTQSQGFSQGDPLVLTWSIIPDGTTQLNGESSDLQEFFNGIYSGGFADYQAVLQDAIGRWGELSGLTIQFEPNDDGRNLTFNRFSSGVVGVRGDIRFGGNPGDGDGGVLASAFFPTIGDVNIDTADQRFYSRLGNNSLGLRNVIAHEFGHSLGFFSQAGHVVSDDTRQLLEPFIDLTFDGPQYHDILSVQRGYGDIYETGAGNDTAANATELGLLLDEDSVVLGGSAHRRGTSALFTAKPTGIEIQPNEVDFVSIDDQTDTDVYSFTVFENGLASVVLDTLGETYDAGGQDQDNEIVFDTSQRVDLTLELLDTDGQTVLATSNDGGFGEDERLSSILLNSSGTYFVRITGVDNPDALTLDTQFYGLSVTYNDTPLGDTNLDGNINFLDITPFISLVSVGEFLEEADLNEDGFVNFLDITPFINVIQSQN